MWIRVQVRTGLKCARKGMSTVIYFTPVGTVGFSYEFNFII